MFDEVGLRIVDEMHHYAEPLTGKPTVSERFHSVTPPYCVACTKAAYTKRKEVVWSLQLNWMLH